MLTSGCPVCGYPAYREHESDGAVTYDICPCCSFQSGVDGVAWDRNERNRTFRRRWVEAGSRWWSTAATPPEGWSADARMRAAGLTEVGEGEEE